MGLIIGLIGANILAKTIGEKVVEAKEAKAAEKIEVEKHRSNMEIQREREIARSERDKARADVAIERTRAYMERDRLRADIEIERLRTMAAMQPNYFSNMYRQGQPAYQQPQQGYYIENGYPQNYQQPQNYAPDVPRLPDGQRVARFCPGCGKPHEPEDMFCQFCGKKF